MKYPTQNPTKSLFAMKIFISFLLLIFAASASAQKTIQPELDSSMHYGVFVNGAMPYHVATFQTIPGCPTCGSEYGTGKGLGADFGGFFEYALGPHLMLNARLGYHDLGA